MGLPNRNGEWWHQLSSYDGGQSMMQYRPGGREGFQYRNWYYIKLIYYSSILDIFTTIASFSVQFKWHGAKNNHPNFMKQTHYHQYLTRLLACRHMFNRIFLTNKDFPLPGLITRKQCSDLIRCMDGSLVWCYNFESRSMPNSKEAL